MYTAPVVSTPSGSSFVMPSPSGSNQSLPFPSRATSGGISHTSMAYGRPASAEGVLSAAVSASSRGLFHRSARVGRRSCLPSTT